MKATKLLLALLASVACICWLGGTAFAGDKEEGHQYSAEEMKAWQEAIAPGAHHGQLKMLEGKWKAEMKMWEAPGAEPTTTTGESEYKLIFGGRFAVQHMNAEMMGMPFEGKGIIGYDNAKGKHTVVWLDNMSTQMMYSEGECKDHCKVETHVATVNDPFGNPHKVKMVTKIADKNKHTFEYYMIGEDGKEFKQMEIVYTRVSS